MSIDQRMSDALADLEGLFAEGAQVEEALIEAASANQVSVEALRSRAERAGDLEHRMLRLHTRSLLSRVVKQYADDVDLLHAPLSLKDWMTAKGLELPLDSVDLAFCDEQIRLRAEEQRQEQRDAFQHLRKLLEEDKAKKNA